MALGWHVRLSCADRRVLTPTIALRRRVLDVILGQTQALALLVFAIVDTHLHLQFAGGDRGSAVSAGKRIVLALGRVLGVGFEPVYVKAIEDQSHMVSTFGYILRQEEHHGLSTIGWPECSSVLDWAQMRPTGRHVASAVNRWLPRAGGQLLRSLGVRRLHPVCGPLEWIVPAGLCAASLPDLAGSDRRRNGLRRALLAVLDADRGLKVRAQAELLGISERTRRRLLERPPSPELVRAVTLQLGAANAGATKLADQFRREANAAYGRDRSHLV
jgi:hypothetical protein